MFSYPWGTSVLERAYILSVRVVIDSLFHRYSTHVQVVSGSTLGGYVIDNEGGNYTTCVYFSSSLFTDRVNYLTPADVETTLASPPVNHRTTLLLSKMKHRDLLWFSRRGTMIRLSRGSSTGLLATCQLVAALVHRVRLAQGHPAERKKLTSLSG